MFDERGTVGFRVQYLISLDVKKYQSTTLMLLGLPSLADSTEMLGHGKDAPTPPSSLPLAATL
jgi:hypothetical protein